jgi:cation-transporting P-type ATPase G
MADACCGDAPATDPDEEPVAFWQLRDVRLAAVAGVGLAVGLVASALDATVVANVGFAGALLAGGATFVPSSLRGLVRGRLGVGTLMTIAAIGAVLLGEYGEAASLAFLFSISEALEDYAMDRTRHGLRALLDLVPELVTVHRDGSETEVTPAELRVGDVMIVRPGERIATDGRIRSGRSALDLSAITGESVPVEAGSGDDVLAAAINGGGVLEIDVTATTDDSSLARVVHIVEAAQENKGTSQRLAERIARPLVPGVMVLAAVVAGAGVAFGDPSLWIERSLVVLVAAAPCAFAISVPVTVVAAVGAATRQGALIKGGAALEALDGIRAVALDKTGTLTRNQPAVVDVVTNDGVTRDHLLAVAAALEARSEHPLAAAVLAAAPGHELEALDVSAVPGNGITGTIDGHLARLGRPGFIDPDNLEPTILHLQSEGSTVVLVEHDHHTLGVIAVRDELRPEAPAVVDRLRRLGISTIAMLTGDNARAAQAIGRTAGITDTRADLLPEDKVTAVEELRRYGRTAMVGDGINDAPALATANVGIAMGAAGSDVAIETADVALLGEDLQHLPDVLAHARRAGRIMRQNLALSGAILITLVPLAATGVLGLATVVATHEIAEVFVIANGIRAGRRNSP